MRRTRLALVVLGTLLAVPILEARSVYAQDLGDLLTGLTRTVNGKKVGPETFFVIEDRLIQNACGIPYHRVDTGIAGTVEGYTVKEGHRIEAFVDEPEFIFQRTNVRKEVFHGIGTYHADKVRRSGMVIFYPASAKDWNGKAYVIAPGSLPYLDVGELIARKCGEFTPYTWANIGHVGLLIDKGYAVVFTRRMAVYPPDIYRARGRLIERAPIQLDEQDAARMESVTLDDGTVLQGKSYNWHGGLIRDLTLAAENFLKSRLGRVPARTYFYGHSGGASLGRAMNYARGVNLGPDGQPVIDGFLVDDAGVGVFLPTKYVDGQDVLLQTDADRSNVVPQIDVVHAVYTGDDFAGGGDHLFNKRENQRILNAKGLGAKSRTYEILGVSHSDAGAQADPAYRANNLDLAGFFDALIDNLDAWVDRGVAPPPTRSAWLELGDADGDGTNEHPPVALTEVACPTGVYYLFPKGTRRSGSTGFTPYLREGRLAINATTEAIPEGFDESWLEPLNEYGYLVDLNGNGVRDTKESIAQAWQRRKREGYRTGILGSDEPLTHATYVSCVSDAASALYEQRMLSGHAMSYEIERAMRSDIGR